MDKKEEKTETVPTEINKKEKFEQPRIDVVLFTSEDIIKASPDAFDVEDEKF